MNLSLQTTLRASLLLAAALATPAKADIIYQSATAGSSPNGGFVVQGDGTTNGSNIIGGVFSVTQTSQVEDIGGNFITSAPGSSSGPIFGEIVAVPNGASAPAQSIENLVALARVVFTPTTDGDFKAALSVLLGPGTYAVLFGGNLTDASGFATLSDGNTPVGSPSLFEDNFGAADPSPWDNFAPADTRIFVDGTIPEPASLTLLAAGLGMLGLARRRRA
jgi:PEP-CTERM motif